MKSMHLFTYDCRPGYLYHIPNAPHTVLWDVCYTCNQRCKFCYNPKSVFKRPCPSSQTSRTILRILLDWGVREVIYLGGEPLTHPGLLDLIHIANRAGCSQRLISNGKLINESVAKFLSEHNVETGISLHGTDKRIHNGLTQTPQSYENAIRAISTLSNASAKWYIQFTPTQSSNTLYNSILQLKKTFPSLALVDINRLLPQGVGFDHVSNIFLSDTEWWNCLMAIPAVRSLGVKISVESVPHCWIYAMADRSRLSPEATQSIISSIRPCFMGINQIAMSDIGCFKMCPGGLPFTESILHASPSLLWQNSEPLKERRKFNFLPPRCVSYDQNKLCPYFYACGGGCKMSCHIGYSSSSLQTADPLITCLDVPSFVTRKESGY